MAAAGWISDDPGVPFAEAANLLGVRVARHGFEAWRRAALDFSALLRRLDIKCHLEPRTLADDRVDAGADAAAQERTEDAARGGP